MATVAIALGAGASLWAAQPPPAAKFAPPGHPVVVELFTSQGCATCPPADRLLAALGRESGGQVVPLAFHVDSWNHAGWTDPFSDAAWTRRHGFYARALRTGGAYTPQAVIDGSVAMVGSDEAALRAAIAAAAGRPAAQVDLQLVPQEERVLARVSVQLSSELDGRALDLFLAVYECGLETPVRRGENGGKRLLDDFVVRSLTQAGRLAAADRPSAAVHFEKELRLAKDWRRSQLGVAAFLQDSRTLSIHGASVRGVNEAGSP